MGKINKYVPNSQADMRFKHKQWSKKKEKEKREAEKVKAEAEARDKEVFSMSTYGFFRL